MKNPLAISRRSSETERGRVVFILPHSLKCQEVLK